MLLLPHSSEHLSTQNKAACVKKRPSLPGRKTRLYSFPSTLAPPKQPCFTLTAQRGPADRVLYSKGPRCGQLRSRRQSPMSCRENRKLCPPLESLPTRKTKPGSHNRAFNFCLFQEDRICREFCPVQRHPRETWELRTREGGSPRPGLRRRELTVCQHLQVFHGGRRGLLLIRDDCVQILPRQTGQAEPESLVPLGLRHSGQLAQRPCFSL